MLTEDIWSDLEIATYAVYSIFDPDGKDKILEIRVLKGGVSWSHFGEPR